LNTNPCNTAFLTTGGFDERLLLNFFIASAGLWPVLIKEDGN
jgi:hypothetical protein